MIRKIYKYYIKKIIDLGYSQFRTYYSIYQQKNNLGIMAVNINSNIGFFAQINWCLYIFAHCEKYKLKPYIILSGSNYVAPEKGNNWFDNYFENLQLNDNDRKNINSKIIKISNVLTVTELGIAQDYDSHLDLEYAFYLFNKYCGIKNEILNKVDSFTERYFKQRKVLGVHYRGADKIVEAPKVEWKTCLDSIKNHINKYPEIRSLFVASAEATFIDFISKEITSIPVYHHDDHVRSHDGTSFHTLSSGSNYEKGEDALINSLLLSRCDYLIRTTSSLSQWSSVFNPDLPVILLNKPYEGKLFFPECAVIKKYGFHYE
jgi:hypothetical protein